MITIAATLAVTSCNDWLDLPPRTESQAKVLLTSQKGFRDALIGAYIDMKSRDIYGAALSWETIEYLSQHWTLTGDNPFRTQTAVSVSVTEALPVRGFVVRLYRRSEDSFAFSFFYAIMV